MTNCIVSGSCLNVKGSSMAEAMVFTCLIFFSFSSFSLESLVLFKATIFSVALCFGTSLRKICSFSILSSMPFASR
ncbi:hypothetical protein DSAG12_04075 [Promethearchaeum syntrophicum]|uniref:Uncharacterized protein n=1 Tax=Promethearchaeum syntrophicum TaxID=2594042 RepID=A0AC61ZTW3_9ARCH|nr:hypothetical protein [Candidatus Prometheoarchaeum syntrophicum]